MSHETYLGDGVYASFDGYQIWLHLGRHDSQPLIGLDDQTFASLIAYRDRLVAEFRSKADRRLSDEKMV